ncbi:CBS domain-containing protein [Limobrevibacterium gyesilva]|uniref:CBS domain-containing protein n=1 Tax=Limobrevibacterium gyesilva TaxID=2991712 RepID=A0AA41YIF1_9PROT|nr:CBS domain-containing protein [Limobrevibacterium gyesilva]MCW3473604.1 CBS domain-containing protein [Limobrevibacterium gyesilva]
MLDQSMASAEDLMTREVVVVHPDTKLATAVKLMAEHAISGIPVVDAAGMPVAMLTEGDLLRWHGEFTEKQAWWLEHLADGYDLAPTFLGALRSQSRKVSAIMSKDVTYVSPETPARELARLFYEKKIKRVPVVRDGKMVGLVSRADLVKALAKELAAEQAAEKA